ncbi:transcriptional regulator [Lonsdalea quercina]|uniref:transcriptional antitermination N peptide n=1 Tax=Lonsdalea quercina TaxID=71657 RepID=UPI003975A5B6
MNSRQRYKANRAAEHREKNQYIKKIDRAYKRLSEGCSDRALKAVTTIEGKMKPARSEKAQPSAGQCLPNVAIYAAGHRKCENITCRGTQKFKGKSIPLI